MTTSPTTDVPAGHTSVGGDRRGRTTVAALAITQTIGYGTLYYAFAVLLNPLAADLHTSTTAVTGAFTASVLVGAVLAVPVGRWLDRHGGRALMAAGSAAGVLLLLLFSRVDQLWQLYAVQVGMGAACAASLYEAAFAVVIALTSPERRAGSLLAVTVVAGFASTVFLPLTGWLVDAHGWRTALLALAALQTVTVPLHALLVRRPAHPVRPRHDAAASNGAIRGALADRGFWLLALGFTAHTAAISALAVHLIAALVSWGHRPAFAATITERYDTGRYATLAGILVVPMTLAKAAGPLAAAALQATTGSYAPVLAAVASCCAVAAVAIAAVISRPAASRHARPS
ncbi:Major Facilitator Superfamily protein [Micromonospora sp. MW-13]|uniref:MFS transporter n=1 Tax=Micromonospora sp. MW-13 TaxID=2094022 RepID=UPI000E450232|nr:MFS transporter [Micromonospora sp. MW-13]RGC66793.1 Major Facilitator Superfamily protein [Micromonospora sp. MW-13]